MFNNRQIKLWQYLTFSLLLGVGILAYSHFAQALATSLSISSPTALNKAYVKPSSTVPVLFYVTADPPGFSAFYTIELVRNSTVYTSHQYSTTFNSGSQGYSQNFNVGAVADNLYGLQMFVPELGAQSLNSVVVDGTPPSSPTVTYPNASGIYLDPTDNVVITWNQSTDANFGATPIRVVYSLSGTFLDGVTIANLPASATSTTWNPPDVSSATVKVAVIATDLAGNITSDASNNAFALDNQAPTVDAGANFSASTPTRPGATASDNISAAANLTYAWGVVSAPSGGTIIFSDSNILDPFLSGTVTGEYVASILVTDQAGNQSFDTVTFNWDGNPAAFNVTAPAGGTYLAGGSQTNIVWSLPGDSDINHFKLYYYDNTSNWTLISNSTASTTTSYLWTVPLYNLGSRQVRVVAYDNDGNFTIANSGLFTIDSTNPAITITNSNLGPINTPTASGASATDANGIASYSWAKVSGPGTITFSTSSTIANPTFSANTDGSYVARLTVTDNAGNTNTADVSFIWDSTNPAITVTNSNLGPINTPTAAGASATDANGIASYSWAKVSGPGTITFSTSSTIANPTFSANTDGSYVARLTVTDNAGNTNTADVSFIWDTTAPSITINPVSPDPTGDSTPSFTGNATDALSTVSAVEYSVDGGAWTACLAADGNFNSSNENYICTISPALIEGAHSVNVRTRDIVGNQSDGSLSDSFTVNLSGPTITPMSDRAEKAQFSQNATTTGATSWTWSYSGPGVITFGTPNAEDTTISADTDGLYTITLTANDGFFDSFESFLLTWDTTAPSITLSALTPDPTGDSTPTLSGNATDALLEISSVQYQVDGGAWNSCVAADGHFSSSNENYNCTVAPALSGGNHTVNVRAVDSLNNTSDGSVSDSFDVDLSGPELDPMSDRAEKAQFSQNATTTGAISWTWSYSGPGVITFGTPNAEDTTISADTDGVYTITLTATDTFSNTNSSSFSLTWDTTAPSITLSALTPDPTGDSTPTFNGNATDALLDISSVQYQVDGGAWNSCVAADGSFNSSNENYVCTIAPALAEGAHSVNVRARDIVGNQSDGSLSDSFTVNLSGPTIATMSDRAEKAQFSQNATTTGAISWTWSYSGPGIITFGTPNAEDTTISADTDGVYTITLTATDTFSNTNSSSFSLTWDTTGPLISVTNSNLGSINIPTAAGVSATDAYTGVVSYAWVKFSGSGTISFSSAANIVNPSFSADLSGAYVARLTATDGLGNTSTADVSFTWSNTPGDFVVTNPQTSDNVLGGGSLSISWTTPFDTDLNHFEAEYSVNNGADWILIDNLITSTSTDLSWSVPAVNSTQALVRISAYDDASNVNSAVSGIFIIDSSPPVITITNPILGTISTSTAAGASASDPYSGIESYLWSQVSGPGLITFTPSGGIANPALSADVSGAYVARLSVFDNVGLSSFSDVSFTWDGNPGAFSVVAPDINTELAGGADFNIVWTQPGGGDTDHFVLEYSLNNGADWQLLNANVSAASSTFSWVAPTAVDSDEALIRVTAVDSYSNQNTALSAAFIIDSSDPIISIGSLALGTIAVPTNSGSSVSDAYSGVADIIWTKVSGPGSVNFAPGNNVADPYFSATLTGSYVVSVEATDDVGNSASATISFTWSGDPATPYFTNPSVNSYLRGGVANNVSWVSSGEDDLDYFSLWYSDDDGANWSLLDGSIASTTSVFSWNTPLVDAGGQLLKLSVFDISTNSTTTLSLPFTIDSTSPSAVAISNPNALSLPWQGASTKTITWTGGDDLNLGATPILLEYSASGNFDDTVVMANVANSGSYDWTAPSVDTVLGAKIRVTSIDLAGNQRVATSSAFIIDSLAPSLTLDADFGNITAAFSPDPVIVDNVDSSAELSYSWSVVSVPAGANLYFSVPFIANPNISGDLAGVYTMALTITDRAGNSVTEQSSFNWSGGSIYPEIIYPTTGDHVPAGTVNIIWTTPNVDNLDHYKIEYSNDAGFSWSTLVSNITAPATSSPWTITAGTNSSNNMVRVTAYDSLDAPYPANSGLFVIDSSAPVISLGPSLGTINTATTVTATATDNFDAANELTYSWSVLSAPSGANLTISSSTILTPALSGSVNGSYLALLTVTDRAGNSASSSVAFTWYISSGGGGGGGGGGGSTSYCTQVEYGPWSSCINGFQTRLVINRSPLLCTLNTAQQLALTQTCAVVPEIPVVEEPTGTEPETPSSSYPFDPEAVDVIENARKSFTKLDQALVNSVIGRIVLQVEDRGRAWYINPKDKKKYYLGRPTNAFQVMRILGDGITTANLERIPVGIMDGSLTMDIDTDKDGLPDRLEKGLRTDWRKADTDGDGHSDYLEVTKGYDPLSKGKPKTDLVFTKKNNGRIFIQVQQNGEAWYIDPISQRRFYLGRPLEALAIMRDLGLGISNKDLNRIPVGTFSDKK